MNAPRLRGLPLFGLLLLPACGPRPTPEDTGHEDDPVAPTCADGPTAPGGDAAPIVGEDGWSFGAGDEVAVSTGSADDLSARVAVADDGSTWVSWYAWELAGIRFRAQRYAPEGEAGLADGGLLVSDHAQESWIMDHALLATPDGDAVIVFADLRTGHRDLHAYRVGPDGAQRWGDDGVSLSAADELDEGPPSAVLLRDGDVAVAWEHIGAGDGATVQVTRLAPDGQPRWAEPVELPCEAGYCGSPVVVPMDGTDVAVVWMESAEWMTDVRSVRARRLDVDGCPVWDADPVLSGGDTIPYYENPAATASPEGLWVAWTAIDGDPTVSVQRLDDDGTVGFGGEPVRVASGRRSFQFDPVLAWDAAGEELLVAWTDTDAAQSQFALGAQRVAADGTLAWGGAGLTVRPWGGEGLRPAAVRTWGDRGLVFIHGEGEQVAVLDDEGVVDAFAVSADAGHANHFRVSETSPAGRWAAVWDDGDVHVAGVGESVGVGTGVDVADAP